jgi:dTDP-glucose 4,6-dehydratase
MSRTLLVTGAAGFIGANFCHHWAAGHPGERIVAYDALTYAGNATSLQPLLKAGVLTFLRADIGDAVAFRAAMVAHDVEWVVNFAAESHVDRSIRDPGAFVRTNVLGTHVMLDVLRDLWGPSAGPTRRFHHVSTDEVYGTLGPDDPPFTETTAYAPNSPYAASKAAADHLVRAYGRTYGVPFTLSNCSNNYGPYQFPEKLIPLCIVNILAGRRLPVYGDGRQVRDWLHVSDHCRAIESILTRAANGASYNVGGGTELPNLVVIETLCRLIDEAFAADPELAQRFPSAPAAKGAASTTLIEFVRDRPGHDRRYAVDGRRLEKDLGFFVDYSFERGLAQTVRWYLDHEPWWRSVMDGSYQDWIRQHYGTSER